MKTKAFLFLFTLLFLTVIGAAQAITNALDIKVWSDYAGVGTNLVDERGYQSGVINGALTRDTSDKPSGLNQSLTGSFTAANYASWASDPASQDLAQNQNRTYILWVKTPVANKGYSGDYGVGQGSVGFLGSDATLPFFYLLDGGNPVAYGGTPVASLSGWHLFEGEYRNDTGNITLYIDGQKQNTTSVYTSLPAFPIQNTVARKIGYTDESAGTGAQAGVAQWIMLTEPLTQTQRTCLYNSGAGRNYTSFITNCISSNFSITAKDYYDNSTLSTFNASVTYNGTTTLYTTTTAQISTAVPSGAAVNVTIIAPSYFNKTYSNYNTTTNLIATPYQVEVRFAATEIITGNSVTGFTVTATNTTNNSAPPILYLKAGNYNITYSKTSWYNKTTQFNYTALQNTTSTFTGVYQSILNVTARNNVTGAAINAFTAYVYSSNYTYSTSGSTTTGNISFPITNGTYKVFFNTTGYSITNETTVISTPGVTNLTLRVFDNSSARIYIYNLTSLTLFNTATLTVSLNGNNLTFYNFTTTNGIVYTGTLPPDTYRIAITGTGVTTTYGVLTIADSAFTEVNYYIDDSAMAKTFSSFDTLGNAVANATVSFSRAINGSFVVFTQVVTDNPGFFTVYLNPLVTYYITGIDPSGAHSDYTGSVTPNQDITYPITWVVVSSGTYPDSYLAGVYRNFTATYYNTTKKINVTWEVISPIGDLSYFGLTVTYNGTSYTQNITGSAGGGISFINISGVNLTTVNTASARFFYKRTNYSEYSFTQNFVFYDYTPRSTAITNIVTNTDNQPTTDIGKAILWTFIMIMVMGGVYKVTGGSAEATSFVGLVFVGFLSLSSVAVYPQVFGMITVTVGTILLGATMLLRRF